MNEQVIRHYSSGRELIGTIKARLAAAGKNLECLTTTDLAPIDEFHIRGRTATLELANAMAIHAPLRIIDLGSGLGGPARTLAEVFGCHVTGIDLTPAYTQAANEMSRWVGLAGLTQFQTADATVLPEFEALFDAAITVHVAMNIAAKDRFYREVHRVLKPGGTFGIYDVLQGEGGHIRYPVPWARESAISHVVTLEQLSTLLRAAGFSIQHVTDTSEDSAVWLAKVVEKFEQNGLPPLSFQAFLGDEFHDMSRQLAGNLEERRIRTVMVICQAGNP